MTVRIKLSDLSSALGHSIIKNLFLTPKVNKYAQSAFGVEATESISFFRKDETYVYVPFFFGMYQLGAKIFWPTTYKSVDWMMKPTFKYRQDKFDQKTTVKTAMEHLQKSRTANLNLFPGAGKTVISACLVSALKIKTLIIFCFQTLKVQWIETFRDLTTANAVLFDGENLEEAEKADVIVCMYSRVPKLGKILETIGCLIIDETHRMCTPDKVEALLSCCPAFIITCSATPERNNGMEKMMHLMAGIENILLKSTKPFRVFKTLVNVSFPVALNVRKKPDWSKTLNNICDNDKRTRIIANLLITIASSGRRTIAVCERIELLRKLEALFEEYVRIYPQYSSIITFDSYYGTKKKCKESNILLGTITKIGTAYDEARSYEHFSGVASSVLVIMSSFKDHNLLEQVVGRIRDRSLEPVVYDIVDNNAICRRHWDNPKGKEEKERGRSYWYHKNGAIVQELKFDW